MVSNTGRNSGAEIYDPRTGLFTNAGAMTVNRRGHIAALLPDGRVLIAGGEAGLVDSPTSPVYDSAEIFDPATGKFTATTSSMSSIRNRFFGLTLANGKVLVGGGFNPGGSCDLFDPATGRFTPTGSDSVTRNFPAYALLSSGELLVAGGNPGPNSSTPSATLYNPATGLFKETGILSRNLNEIEAAIRRYAIDCDYERTGEIEVASGAT
jgi:hypothetical protein